jgi:hypothetical protein
MRTVFAFAVVALAAQPLFAWEVESGQAAAERAGEVVAATPGAKEAVEFRERASKQAEPGWVKKTAWRVDEDGKHYSFGVGSIGNMRQPIRFRVAEMRARAAIASLTGKTTVERRERGSGSGVAVKTAGRVQAMPLDWYEAPDGTVWALVMEVR